MDFTCHSKRTIARKLLRYSIAITSPVCRAHKTLGKDLGNIRPVCFVVEGIFAIALRSPRFFEFEVRGNCNSEELIGPFHKEGFSALGKVRVEHPSSGKAVRDVVDNIGGDLDPKLGAIGRLMDFGKSCIHGIFEAFEIFSFLLGQSVHDVPLVCWREFRGCLDSCTVVCRCQISRSLESVQVGLLRIRCWIRRCCLLEDELKG